MDRMDIAIVGTGPAGVSAAVTAKLRNKKVTLLGSAELSAKMSKAHDIRNYTGLPTSAARSWQRTCAPTSTPWAWR